MAKVDKDALELVIEDLEQGADLKLQHIGSVFGQDFWMLLVEALLDAQDSARAIAGAINRLQAKEPDIDDDEEGDFDDE